MKSKTRFTRIISRIPTNLIAANLKRNRQLATLLANGWAGALMMVTAMLGGPIQVQGGLVPLHSWYDENRGDAFTTTHPTWIGSQGQTRSPSYDFNRAEGYVFDPSASQPPTTIPLYGWYSPSRGDNFLSSTWTGRPGDVRSPDYDFVRLEGYAYDRPLAGTLPLHGFWNSLLGDNRQTSTPVWERSTGPYFPFYDFVRTEGYILPSINPPPFTPRHFGNGTMLVDGQSATGTRPLLLIMVNYTDNTFRAPHSASYYQDMFFGSAPNRSVSGHFYWNSQFSFLWSNAGIVNVAMPDDPTTPANETLFSFWSTAGSNIAKHDAMVLQAAAAAGVNFASFDLNRDGVVSTTELGVMVINASPVGNSCGQSRGHQAVTLNGKRISLFMSHIDEGAGFATICHELYHQFGMDHVYGNPSINNSYTPMAGTCGAEDSHIHSNLDAYHKLRLGWIAPRIYSSSGMGACAQLNAPQYQEGTPTDNLPIILFDAAHQTSNGDEYFILEYRRPTPGTDNSYDANFPGNGLVIWWVRTGPGTENFRHFRKIRPGADGVLQSTVAIGSDDQAVDVSIPPDGRPDVIRPGSDFELQSVRRGDDQIADDSAMMYYGAPNGTWGTGGTWDFSHGEIPLTYYDGSDSGFRVRVGPTSNGGNTIAIEWNMDDIAPRLDRILSPTPACATPRTEVILEGMFGASQRDRRVALQNGSSIYDLNVRQWTCHRIVATIPDGVPAGDYMLTTYGSADHSLPGNSLPFEVKQPFRLETIMDGEFLGVRGTGDDSTRSVLQYSLDLRQWKTIQTNEGPFQYLDPNVGKFKRKFYRLIALP